MKRDENAAPGVASTKSGDSQSTAGANAQPHSITEPQACLAPAHGRIVGVVWRKNVRRSIHQLKAPPAWAVDCQDLARAIACGALWLELREQERGEVFRCRLATLQQRGVEIDRGAGRQIYLPLGAWVVSDDGHRDLEPQPLQLSLFGEVRP